MLLKSFFIIVFLILIALEPALKSEVNATQLITFSILFLLSTFIHFYNNKSQNWFRLDTMFIFGFAIVHFQWPVMYAINGINPTDYSLFWATSTYLQYMNYGTWLSTLGMVSWFLGFSLLKKQNIQSEEFKNFRFSYEYFFYFTLLLFIIFLITAGQQYLSGAFYRGEAKSATGAGISVYFQLLFSYSIIILCTVTILNIIKYKNSHFVKLLLKIDKKVWLIFSATIFLYLFVGDRGGALQPMLATLILYGTLIKPITKKQFFIIIISGALLMTMIGLGRSDKSNENILLAGASKIQMNSNYDVTLELANSARTLYKSLSNVPEYHDYFYGKLWISHLLANIPLAQSMYLNISDDKFYELDSAEYITFITRGKYSTWGEGSSLIADIYLNFGTFGVVIFMLLFGILFKKITNEFTLQSNIYWITAGAILAAYAFYLGRGGLLYPLRPMFWSLLLVLFFIKKTR